MPHGESRERDGDDEWSHEDDSPRDGGWSDEDNRHDDDWHDRDDPDCYGKKHDGDHDAMTYEKKMAITGVLLGLIAIIVIVIVVLCCCKKKNRRNMSVANLQGPTTALPVKVTPKAPIHDGGPMPVKTQKGLETLHVPAPPTAPTSRLDLFGVPPPAYRSTVDLREETGDPRDGFTIASPPPNYEA